MRQGNGVLKIRVQREEAVQKLYHKIGFWNKNLTPSWRGRE